MKVTYYTVWILFLTVAQSTLINIVQIYGIKPNVFLIFVVFTAMFGGITHATVIGFVSGFIFDFLSGKTLGVSMLLFMYMGAASGFIFQKVLTNKYSVIILVIFGVSIIYGFLFYTMNFMIWGEGSLLYAMLRVIIPETIYNTAICIPFYLIVRKTLQAGREAL